MAAYTCAFDGLPAAAPARFAAPLSGSFRATCTGFYGSPEFRRLDPATQAWHRRCLDAVAAKHGDHPIRRMEPRHVRKLRDDRQDTPDAANTLLKALRSLFRYAVETDLVAADPTRDIRRLRIVSEGHHSWTLDEIATFEARHPVGSKARLAMTLILYTSCRREDAVRLGRQHVRAGRIRFIQAKGEHRRPMEIDIPLHPDLEAVIAETPAQNLTFLTTAYGRPFSVAGFGNWFRDRCNEAGLPHCSAHGLRKATAATLAEKGATDHEIMSITGHRTLSEVQRYTRAARRRVMADSAMEKLKR